MTKLERKELELWCMAFYAAASELWIQAKDEEGYVFCREIANAIAQECGASMFELC